MQVNGVDLSKLEHEQEQEITVRDKVPGRVAHIDADFLAYMVSAESAQDIANGGKSLPDMKEHADIMIEKFRLGSGAEKVQLHLTPSGSNKGGRYEQAIQKEYQANRKDPDKKPKYLNVIRAWMHKERGASMHTECEADDGMSMMQYAAIAEDNKDKSIIITKDKDLLMVPGLQLDWDTFEITDTDDPFGYTILDDSKKTKKIKGRGWKFFWAQMLTGDSADNIQGLPKVYDPKFLPGKPKACGPVMADEILSHMRNNKEAFELVRDLYKMVGDNQGFVHWETEEEVPFGQVFQSEARLLWMRRNHNIDDALHWMQETCL